MYVTRPLSQLLKSPELLAAAPDGPNSGFLVIQDEESIRYSCFGMCKNRSLKQLPFPQDKELIVKYTTINVKFEGESVEVSPDSSHDPLFFIPVLNQPLSSNQYYAIVPHRKRIGEALTCSREEDKVTCFCRCVKDVKPRPLDPGNIYQQFLIVPYESVCNPGGYFVGKSIASDGFPPYFLRRKGWTICTKTPGTFKLDTAGGLDSHLRARLPELGGSSASRMVGKWYTPFIFVKEGSLRDQVKESMYYEITLEQRWEQIFKTSDHHKGNSVVIDATFEKEQVFVGGSKATWDERKAVDGVIWFKPIGGGGGGGGVGLRVELLERMRWEQERGGWRGREEGREVKINKVVEFEGGSWNEFGCYVLVERFNLKRMDGSLVMSYDFKHFHHLETKWE